MSDTVIAILAIAQALLQDYSNQQIAQRPPTAEEQARSIAAQSFVEQEWEALKPK